MKTLKHKCSRNAMNGNVTFSFNFCSECKKGELQLHFFLLLLIPERILSH
jgi:hypothetical protein